MTDPRRLREPEAGDAEVEKLAPLLEGSGLRVDAVDDSHVYVVAETHPETLGTKIHRELVADGDEETLRVWISRLRSAFAL